MIDRSHTLPLTRQARELGVSRGSIYYLPRPDVACQWIRVADSKVHEGLAFPHGIPIADVGLGFGWRLGW